MPHKFNSETGRLAGSKSKSTLKMAERIRFSFAEFIQKNIKQIQNDYDSLETPAERLRFLIDVSKEVMPKQKQIEITGEIQHKIVNVKRTGNWNS